MAMPRWVRTADTGSAYGSGVDLYAPGTDIQAIGKANVQYNLSGTSPATALVAGAAGLIKSLAPNLGGAEIRRLLIDGAIAGGRTVLEPGGTRKPVLDIDQSLRLLGQRYGGAVCHNRLWANGTTLFADRDSGIATPIKSLSDTVRSFDSFHGGSKLLVTLRDSSQRVLTWNGAAWLESAAASSVATLVADTSVTRISGASRSRRGLPHDGDTAAILWSDFRRLSHADSLILRTVGGTTTAVVMLERETLPYWNDADPRTLVDSVSGANIVSLAVSEDGTELSYTRMRGAVHFRWRWQSTLPEQDFIYDYDLNADVVSASPCEAVFRSIATGVEVTKPAGGQCTPRGSQSGAGAGAAALRMPIASARGSRPVGRAP